MDFALVLNSIDHMLKLIWVGCRRVMYLNPIATKPCLLELLGGISSSSMIYGGICKYDAITHAGYKSLHIRHAIQSQ